jgi:hypothetical protein
MAIADIKNPTNRRILITLLSPVAVVLGVMIGAFEGLREALTDIRSAW